MGQCCSAGSPQRRTPRDGHSQDAGSDTGPAIGKNRPLRPEAPYWKSETAVSAEDMRRKREEFWETAPAYEGRQEMWEALKGACEAVLSNNFDLAQAIVDGVNISLPTGSLSESYDTLGNRYVIPKFCLSDPSNLGASKSSSRSQTGEADAPPDGEQVIYKLRLSTCKDIKMPVYTSESIAAIKNRLGNEEGFDGRKCRFFLSGKQLDGKLLVGDLQIPKGFVILVQVPP